MAAGTRRGRPRNVVARGRIVAAGGELFVAQGYLATTMGEIAAAAEVSVQTIYSAFTSKVGVLAAVHDVAIAGDDEDLPLIERAWFHALADEPTAADAWRAALNQIADSTARVAPIYAVMLAAESDPEVASVLAGLREQRLAFSQLLVEQLLSRPGGTAVDPDRLADLIYALESVETHVLLVTQRGWPFDRWRSWVRDAVLAELGLVVALSDR